MDLFETGFMLFAMFGITIGPIMAVMTGWRLVKGPERNKEDIKFFAVIVFCVLLSVWGRSYFKSQECSDFSDNGYTSKEECEEEYQFIEYDPDAPTFRGD